MNKKEFYSKMPDDIKELLTRTHPLTEQQNEFKQYDAVKLSAKQEEKEEPIDVKQTFHEYQKKNEIPEWLDDPYEYEEPKPKRGFFFTALKTLTFIVSILIMSYMILENIKLHQAMSVYQENIATSEKLKKDYDELNKKYQILELELAEKVALIEKIEAEEIESTQLAPIETKKTDQPTIYTVKKGDSLSRIAEQFYGHAKYKSLIVDANQLKNPDQLTIDMKLKIPLKP